MSNIPYYSMTYVDVWTWSGVGKVAYKLATNQGVVGSIPASRTIIEKPAISVAGFFIWSVL
ncbi:MAG: hypothetical protein IAE92_00640 [Burkholderiaceae bacterium]|nr:hypothetical protein [Burkholderiaceae bacterium]